MSKPFELTIYPPAKADVPVDFTDVSRGTTVTSWFYRNAGLLTSYPPRIDKRKRLTQAELAASVWWSIVQFYTEQLGPERQEWARRNMILERFATLPHYDETTGQTAHQEGTP